MAVNPREIGAENYERVVAYYRAHLGCTQQNCASDLRLSPMSVNRHVKTMRTDTSIQDAGTHSTDRAPETRHKLPDRRLTASFDLHHELTHSRWIVSIGFYHDGTSGTGDIGEVFIESELDTAADSGLLARDAAILISIALQYGVPIDVLAEAVSRTQQEDGQPQTIIGSALDALLYHGPLVEKRAAE